ncbi:hypothetical protein FISHEDRAFT_75664 [Fistulina hepatica ATCC 64428]|uniref:Zn(2)-C6 fungal-type domain-containing protein n=1 Tax=Fistulina hepatica ATCC 64428 TaxID=1128425 RepID=A0A0D7A6S2_9AGAR|nr:hypothetical protein FISHEDRAFT_75664 [Fistulina hepatica ATCC 64428]
MDPFDATRRQRDRDRRLRAAIQGSPVQSRPTPHSSYAHTSAPSTSHSLPPIRHLDFYLPPTDFIMPSPSSSSTAAGASSSTAHPTTSPTHPSSSHTGPASSSTQPPDPPFATSSTSMYPGPPGPSSDPFPLSSTTFDPPRSSGALYDRPSYEPRGSYDAPRGSPFGTPRGSSFDTPRGSIEATRGSYDTSRSTFDRPSFEPSARGSGYEMSRSAIGSPTTSSRAFNPVPRRTTTYSDRPTFSSGVARAHALSPFDQPRVSYASASPTESRGYASSSSGAAALYTTSTSPTDPRSYAAAASTSATTTTTTAMSAFDPTRSATSTLGSTFDLPRGAPAYSPTSVVRGFAGSSTSPTVAAAGGFDVARTYAVSPTESRARFKSDPESESYHEEPATDAPPPKKKRRRQALSCTECKRRKIKCDREKYVSRAEHEHLKARVTQLEELVQRITATPGALGPVGYYGSMPPPGSSGMGPPPPPGSVAMPPGSSVLSSTVLGGGGISSTTESGGSIGGMPPPPTSGSGGGLSPSSGLPGYMSEGMYATGPTYSSTHSTGYASGSAYGSESTYDDGATYESGRALPSGSGPGYVQDLASAGEAYDGGSGLYTGMPVDVEFPPSRAAFTYSSHALSPATSTAYPSTSYDMYPPQMSSPSSTATYSALTDAKQSLSPTAVHTRSVITRPSLARSTSLSMVHSTSAPLAHYKPSTKRPAALSVSPVSPRSNKRQRLGEDTSTPTSIRVTSGTPKHPLDTPERQSPPPPPWEMSRSHPPDTYSREDTASGPLSYQPKNYRAPPPSSRTLHPSQAQQLGGARALVARIYRCNPHFNYGGGAPVVAGSV